MKIILRTIILIALVIGNFAAASYKGQPHCDKLITQCTSPSKCKISILQIPCVHEEGWDTMPEIKFWRRVVAAPKDSSVVSIYSTRRVLKSVSRKVVDSMEKLGKLEVLRNEINEEYNLPEGTRVMFTGGKKWFYNFDGVSRHIARGLAVFDSLGVDPYYAQTVLLIESPASNTLKSFAGAYGHFQIMPFNARKYGLRVDKWVDERENFERSAYVSAMLFKETFIPLARRWCNELGFAVDEKAIWFKLLVMHCYNAGPYGVKSAMNTVPNSYQGNALIHKLWHTLAPYFPSEAQNYSQLAVACYLEYEKTTSKNERVSSKIYNRF